MFTKVSHEKTSIQKKIASTVRIGKRQLISMTDSYGYPFSFLLTLQFIVAHNLEDCADVPVESSQFSPS